VIGHVIRRPGRRLAHLGVRALALAVCAALFLAAAPPTTGSARRARLAARFPFTPMELPTTGDTAPTGGYRTHRSVNPAYERIEGWISSVGAGVAFGDVDGDTFANDLCTVDPRTDTVRVTRAPGVPERYPGFALRPDRLATDSTMAPMGCLIGDLNADGWSDLAVYYWGRSPILYVRRPPATPPASPPGTSSAARSGSSGSIGAGDFRAEELVPDVPRWFTNAATLADVDGDGHVDLVVANYFPDGSRVLDPDAHGGAVMQDSMSRAFNGGGTHFLLGDPGPAPQHHVAFRPVASDLDYEELQGWTLAVGARDLDGDLLPELYLANDFGPDRLLANRSRPGRLRFRAVEGRRRFTTPASLVLGHDSFKGMGVDFGDIDGDGRTDIFVGNITSPYALHESNFAFLGTGHTGQLRAGGAPFENHSESLGLARSGWAWDGKLADLDNDGSAEIVQARGFLHGTVDRWPELQELAMGNDELLHDPRFWPRFAAGDDLSGGQGTSLLVRDGSRFVDVADLVGLDRATVSRGVALADPEGDGDLDMVIARQWANFRYYRNDTDGARNSLVLRLRRPLAGPAGEAGRGPTTTPAIGAVATVVLPDGRELRGEVDGGSGHSGKRSDELHFGLDAVTGELTVRVDWRDVDGDLQHTELRVRPGRHSINLGNP
jgi:hypothetical protein